MKFRVLSAGIAAILLVIATTAQATHPRPKAATPYQASLVPAYPQCTAQNRAHGPPLSFPSCSPPTQTSGQATVGTADAFGGPPNYEAVNSDNNTGLQVTNVPANLITPRGGMIYITEIYNTHQLLTPVANFGLRIPTTLYSIAYF